jgi:hypothetical protein
MRDVIAGLYEDWLRLDERIETIAAEIETIGEKEAAISWQRPWPTSWRG